MLKSQRMYHPKEQIKWLICCKMSGFHMSIRDSIFIQVIECFDHTKVSKRFRVAFEVKTFDKLYKITVADAYMESTDYMYVCVRVWIMD